MAELADEPRDEPIGHVSPDSLEEFVNIVEEAERLGRGVRAVGSGWSNSDVAVTSPTSSRRTGSTASSRTCSARA